jgi:hypothetical protein
MRRRTLLVVLAGLAVVIAAGAVALWPNEQGTVVFSGTLLTVDPPLPVTPQLE